jgi:F-type H+-transporting ATPase subunit b
MELLKLLNTSLVVAQIICFLVLLWLMKKFLWKPVFSILEVRRAHVQQEMNSLNEAKADVAKLKAEYQEFIDRVDEMAKKRLREIEGVGEEKAHEIRDHARQEAERIVEDARREIRFELAKSKEMLKADVVEMVIKTTERMIQEKLSFEDDRKIIDDFLSQMDKK